MEKLRSENPDSVASAPISAREKSNQLQEAHDDLIHQRITPEEALDRASSAFEIASDRTSIPLSTHVINANHIKEYQAGAKTFGAIAEHSGEGTTISFTPNGSTASGSGHDKFAVPVGEYAELLSERAKLQIDENFVSFSGIEPVLSNPYQSPDYEKDTVALSAMLFREQWSSQKLNTISIHEMPEGDFPIDTNQIILLSEIQATLALLNDKDSALNSQQRKKTLDTILESLNSPELAISKLKGRPAAMAIKLLAEARTLHDLGELSEDANPSDFARNKVGYGKLAILKLREAEKNVDQAAYTAAGLDAVRDKIRYYHDTFAGEIGYDQVKWSGDSLSELAPFDITEFSLSRHTPSTYRAVGASAAKHSEAPVSSVLVK